MSEPVARRIRISGRVQGVGFRPFVYRTAQRHGIRGWVRNCSGTVEIHAEGDAAAVTRFAAALVAEAPPLAAPHALASDACAPLAVDGFSILDSAPSASADVHLPPDGFVCDDCLAELRNPADRRYRYPFINCTQCGPRYTLITALPYDRANTAMRDFALCPACRREYADPCNRRFHAEPLACPVCGPHLRFVGAAGNLDGDEAALAATVAALKAGRIVAVKGVGGYHLLCDAANAAAVATLRARKARPAKPLAVMFRDLDGVRAAAGLTPQAAALLSSPERPIVLLPRRTPGVLCEAIAPGLGEIGCLLPYSPLHALLLDDFGAPLVATSGNIAGEPVLTDDAEAQARLAAVADAFLHHDRPIVRPADDAVYRPIAGAPRPLRIGRGSAPLELDLPRALREPVLALGSHMKNTLCLAWDTRAVVSPHIGELDSARSLDVLVRVAEDLQRIYQVRATRLLIDAHPGFGYRRLAREAGLPSTSIPHHRAHASALAWEFPQVGHWIVFTWDGVGLGDDGTLWGGEAWVGRPGGWQHAATWRPFHLPGGERAAREPWRAAAALLWALGRPAPFAPDALCKAWAARVNSPQTTSVGRLFDAAAALCGVCTHASFEGEAPMRLEAACADGVEGTVTLPLSRDADGLWQSDWAPLVPMLADATRPAGERAAVFHESLAAALVAQARQLRERTGIATVGLTGGVFQNRRLTERALARLAAAGFECHLPQRLPVNDAGISLGQVAEFLAQHTPA